MSGVTIMVQPMIGFRLSPTLNCHSELPLPPPRFTINIGHGEGDVALNFNVDFNSKRVVMKTLQGGSGSHEKTLDSFPFDKGQVFKVRPSVFVNVL
uniref:Galectin n=1 Tax=Paramormyrops kingsleyae TaxID=1676925 RepID=A0A3B3QRH8_9TELE